MKRRVEICEIIQLMVKLRIEIVEKIMSLVPVKLGNCYGTEFVQTSGKIRRIQ